jgi:hypothetical protein
MVGCNDGPALERDAGRELDASAESAPGPDSATSASDEPQRPIPSERAALCARPADDAVRAVFCRGSDLSVSSLRQLAARLQMRALPVDMDEAAAALVQVDDPTKVVEHAVFLAHSTALSGQLVSSINPRAILLSKNTQIAFQRGVQKVEIATVDRLSGKPNFYLLTFKQACNEQASGCLPGDLYTLSVESDWSSVALQDDEDLKNTPLDCRQCHQRKLAAPGLLMRELFGPWPHFFFVDRDQDPYEPGAEQPGRALVRDYRLAKGSESYAGIASAELRQTAGLSLQQAIRTTQALQFDPSISLQLDETSSAGSPRRSAIWDREYAAFKRGEQLPLPYFEQDPSDPQKRAALSAAYARYRRGELAAEALPDLADIFPDDAQVRAEIGLQTEPDATAAQALVQGCGSCHNDVLDQTLSRARFNVALSRMSRGELDLAITRIELAPGSEGAMPPPGMRQLSPESRQRLLTYLRENVRSAADDALLEGAALHGMAKEGSGYAGL